MLQRNTWNSWDVFALFWSKAASQDSWVEQVRERNVSRYCSGSVPTESHARCLCIISTECYVESIKTSNEALRNIYMLNCIPLFEVYLH